MVVVQVLCDAQFHVLASHVSKERIIGIAPQSEDEVLPMVPLPEATFGHNEVDALSTDSALDIWRRFLVTFCKNRFGIAETEITPIVDAQLFLPAGMGGLGMIDPKTSAGLTTLLGVQWRPWFVAHCRLCLKTLLKLMLCISKTF
jgi:hypothetical protein